MKSWTKVRGEMPSESQTRMDMRLQETLSRPPGLAADEFMALRALWLPRTTFHWAEISTSW
jgi:hypothetical protein